MKSNTKRRNFSAEFKAKVALEAVREQLTIEAICKKHELHPSQVNTWKKAFISNASAVFEQEKQSPVVDNEALIQTLYAQIGELKVANDWLKKKLK
jgi:transposase-like protein